MLPSYTNKEKFPSVINLILRYLATIWNQNKLSWGSESNWPITMNLKGSCYIIFAPWHINRCISTYKGKQLFPESSEGQNGLRETWHLCLLAAFYFGWLCYFDNIFDSNYSSWFRPLFHLMLKHLMMSNQDWYIQTFRSRYYLPLSPPASKQGISKEKGPHTFLFQVLFSSKGSHLQSNLDLPSHNFIKSLPTTEIICCIRFSLISFIPIPETVCMCHSL